MNEEKDLLALRAAAESRDPQACQFLLKALLGRLEFYIALAVALERAYAHLSTFEAQYPQARFARQILVQMASLGTAPPRLPPEALRDFVAPGAANFMKCLSDLAFALHPNTAPPAKIGYIVSAVVHAIMADLVAAWYGPRPDDWERVRANTIDPVSGAYRDPTATQIAYAFWTDPQTAARDTAAWLAVADSVAEKLKKSAR